MSRVEEEAVTCHCAARQPAHRISDVALGWLRRRGASRAVHEQLHRLSGILEAPPGIVVALRQLIGAPLVANANYRRLGWPQSPRRLRPRVSPIVIHCPHLGLELGPVHRYGGDALRRRCLSWHFQKHRFQLESGTPATSSFSLFLQKTQPSRPSPLPPPSSLAVEQKRAPWRGPPPHPGASVRLGAPAAPELGHPVVAIGTGRLFEQIRGCL